MTRGILAALCAALAVLTCIPAVAEAVEVSATACVLMDADTGQVLYEKNGDKRMLIASTTKLMTALVALELGEPSQVITVTAAHMAEGSSMYLRPGERLTLEELLYGLLLCSGNDAALALTECAGGVAPFVERMNEKAAALGMRNSHFANPNGLDDEAHYSTAYDMLLRAADASGHVEVRDAYLEDAEAMLVEDGWVIPLYYPHRHSGLGQHLTAPLYDGAGVYLFSGVVRQTPQ